MSGGVALVFGVTRDWAYAASTTLLAIQETCTAQDLTFVVFHDGLTAVQKRLMNRIARVEFHDFDLPLANSTRFARLSKLTFARYECFRMLDRFRRVVWIDADALVKADVSPLLDMEVAGLAMYQHSGLAIGVSFAQAVPGYDMQRPCFNAGILVADGRLSNPTEICEWCYRKTNEWSQAINSDQAVINLMLQEFDLQVTPLNQRFNCEPARENDATVIVHPWGPKKLWHHPVHPLWFRHYRRWRLMGGDGPKVVPPPRRLGRVRNLLDTGICRFRRALAYAGV